MTRKASLLFVLAPVLAFSSPAHAQFSVYGTVTLDHLTGTNSSPVLRTLSPLPCTGTQTTDCTSYKSAVDPIGFTGGVSYDIRQVGPVLLSADVRAVVANSHQGAQANAQGSGTHIDSYLGGVRGSFRTPLSILRPYVQGSVGFARSNFGVLTNAMQAQTAFPGAGSQNGIEYHAFVGADLRVLPIADWRVVEVGYGAIQTAGTYGHSYPLYTIATGIVLHFPPRP